MFLWEKRETLSSLTQNFWSSIIKKDNVTEKVDCLLQTIDEEQNVYDIVGDSQ